MRKFLFIVLSVLAVTAAWIGLQNQLAAPAQPTLRLLGMTLDNFGQDAYEFEVLNTTNEDLVFVGGGPQSPLMLCQTWTPKGWQDLDTSGGCYTGISKQVLPAGARLRFGQRRATDQTVRLGIGLATDREWNKRPFSFSWLPEALSNPLRDWQRKRLRQRGEKNILWSERLDCIPHSIPEAMVMEFVMEGGANMDETNMRTEAPWRFHTPLGPASTPPMTNPSDGSPTGFMVPDPYAPKPAPIPVQFFEPPPGGMAPPAPVALGSP